MANAETTIAATEETTTTAVVVPVVKTEELKTEGAVALKSATELVIDSDSMFELAADELKTVKGTINKLEEMRLAVSGPLHKAMTANNDNFKAIKAPWEKAEANLKSAMLGWTEKQEALRLEAERKAQAEADAARRAAEEQAEAARKAAEEAQAALQTASDSSKAEELQQVVEQAHAQAEAFELEAAIVVAAPAPVAAPRATGISVRGTWKGSVTSLPDLIKHVAEHHEANPALLDLIQVDQQVLNRLAKALGKNLNLPGVNAVFERAIASRSS